MTERAVLLWIHENLVPKMREAMALKPTICYPTDLLAAMTYRETGFLIARYVSKGMKPEDIHPLMRGDYSQRKGESKPMYHGYGYMQIDTGSFPAWINTGAWKDPVKTYIKAMEVLEGKREYLLNKFGIALLNATVAAYNCGEGNVSKILSGRVVKDGETVTDVDYFTHQKNYSKEVFRLQALYNSLPETQ